MEHKNTLNLHKDLWWATLTMQWTETSLFSKSGLGRAAGAFLLILFFIYIQLISISSMDRAKISRKCYSLWSVLSRWSKHLAQSLNTAHVVLLQSKIQFHVNWIIIPGVWLWVFFFRQSVVWSLCRLLGNQNRHINTDTLLSFLLFKNKNQNP